MKINKEFLQKVQFWQLRAMPVAALSALLLFGSWVGFATIEAMSGVLATVLSVWEAAIKINGEHK